MKKVKQTRFDHSEPAKTRLQSTAEIKELRVLFIRDVDFEKTAMMKNLMHAGLVLMIIGVGCGTTPETTNQTESNVVPTDVSSARAETLMGGFIDAFGSAWANGDAEGIAATYTEDGVRIIGAAQKAFNGREEIAASFGEVAEGGKLQNTHVDITTTDVRFVSEDLIIGCGHFKIMNASDEALIEGKWGNTYRVEGDELLMLMESAYRLGEAVDEAANAGTVQEMQADWDCADSKACAQVDANVAAFVSNLNANKRDEVSMLFRADGIRSVSGNSEIALDRAGVLKSLQGENGGTLSAQMKGFKDVGNNLVVAHGQWQVQGPNGDVAAFGQWGNLFETSDSGALLVMESAGRYLVD